MASKPNERARVILLQLRNFAAIADTRTLSAAADAVGLSYSAGSLHVKTLEDVLGFPPVDRSWCPSVLTDLGTALVSYRRRLADLIPLALAKLRAQYPKPKVCIHTGLSGDLASLVRGGELDFAVSAAPKRSLDGLEMRTFSISCRSPSQLGTSNWGRLKKF